MVPKREKMISRSSSVVTGFNLQTKRTFSGGLTSASGRSPTYSTRTDGGGGRKPEGRWCTGVEPEEARAEGLLHHFQKDGPRLGFFFVQNLLQLFAFFAFRVVDHLVGSDASALRRHSSNGPSRGRSCPMPAQRRVPSPLWEANTHIQLLSGGLR